MSGPLYNKTLERGEILFDQGDDGDTAYLIEKGRLEVLVNVEGRENQVAILEPGEIVGEMSIIDGSKRSATIRALEKSTVSVISGGQLTERVEDSDPVVQLLIAILLRRIRANLGHRHIQGTTTGILKKSNIINEDLIIKKIRFEKKLQEALLEKEFEMFFQPIINFQTNQYSGFEALIRWTGSSDDKKVTPDVFMGVAEETSLIIPLGHWIIRESCKNLNRIKKLYKKLNIKEPEDFFLSINVSGRQLGDPQFFNVIKETISKYQIPAKQIKLEITERVLVEKQFVMAWIDKCRKMGISVALDDFGTGYSSLSYLHGLNVDCIKLDKSFVHGMIKDQKTRVIANSIVSMALGLDLSIIAEGIETIEQEKLLKKMGCALGQGYIYSAPLSIDKLYEIIENNNSKEEFEKKAA